MLLLDNQPDYFQVLQGDDVVKVPKMNLNEAQMQHLSSLQSVPGIASAQPRIQPIPSRPPKDAGQYMAEFGARAGQVLQRVALRQMKANQLEAKNAAIQQGQLAAPNAAAQQAGMQLPPGMEGPPAPWQTQAVNPVVENTAPTMVPGLEGANIPSIKDMTNVQELQEMQNMGLNIPMSIQNIFR